MTFNTDKNKLNKMWDKVEQNNNIIITQKDTNNFIIDNVQELNRKNSVFTTLTDFSSDFQVSSLIIDVPASGGGTVKRLDGSFLEYRLQFNDLDESFIPYIQCIFMYKPPAGIVPSRPNLFNPNELIYFDEELAFAGFGENLLAMNQFFEINSTGIELIAFMKMDFLVSQIHEVEFKIVCYIINPHYYQST